ncbi:hypothetical protein [Glycomyces paridis]|uniref:Aminopeptidase n=1 Tax=Glycomyces paridis TaxID=2126555 RepID=A0A4S8PIX4_9ACTN|nr:hypothetical protein [Glycomyces paridis]THV28349.1 hypothetical protein E9998_12125 [Glycomyces paridis]
MSGAGRAAEAMAAAIALLRPAPGRALLVTRGDDPLWMLLADACRRLGWQVAHRTLDDGDREWAPPAPGERAGQVRFQGELLPCDLVVHHDPFGGDPHGGGPADLERLCGNGTAFVCVDYPHGLADPALRAALTEVYLRALATPLDALRERADRLARRLDAADALEIRFGSDAEADTDRALRVGRPWSVRTDFGSAATDLPVLQLPLGEVWIACRPDSVQGPLTVQDGPGEDRSRRYTVEDGRLVEADGRPADLRPIVEIGFGVNPDARWIPTTALGEKAADSLHIGFGDNTLIGGDVADDVHYDLPLPRTARARLVGAAAEATAP